VKTKLEFKGKLLSFRDILHLTGKEKHCKKCIMNDTEAAKWVNHLLEISYREIG
jgi:hypothetical protein